MVSRRLFIAVTAVLSLALAATWAQQRPGSASAPSSKWPWPASTDAVVAAPGNHKVLYEDDNVRILSVTVQPGEKEKQHTHRWPSVLIFDSYPKLRNTTEDGKVLVRNGLGPNDAFPVVLSMPPQGPHSIEDVDTLPVHIYRLEFKKIQFRNINPGGGFKADTPH